MCVIYRLKLMKTRLIHLAVAMLQVCKNAKQDQIQANVYDVVLVARIVGGSGGQ